MQDKFINSLPTPRRPRSPARANVNIEATEPESSAEPIYYYCTRCRDAYNVRTVNIHPLEVLYSEKQLLATMIILTLGILVLLTSSSVILTMYPSIHDIAFEIEGWISLPYLYLHFI
jgi:hypothetical protein